MKPLRQVLESVADGSLSVDAALDRMSAAETSAAATIPGDQSPPSTGEDRAQSAQLGFATVDLSREARCGFPEVIYCPGKTPAQAARIAEEILSRSPRCLLTRADPAQAEAVQRIVPDAVYHAVPRCITIDPTPLPATGKVAVVAAGTTDLPVAEEAWRTAEIMGADVETHWDVGVAGLHRLLGRIDAVRRARVIIAVAGMEGALVSVLGGLVDRPVVAVPTSVGTGLHLDGVVPLLAMLNSCAPGVGVVNVDNGFSAGYLAALINRTGDPTP